MHECHYFLEKFATDLSVREMFAGHSTCTIVDHYREEEDALVLYAPEADLFIIYHFQNKRLQNVTLRLARYFNELTDACEQSNNAIINKEFMRNVHAGVPIFSGNIVCKSGIFINFLYQ